MNSTIHLSWFALIFIGLVVIAVGLAGLKVLSLLVNTLSGRRKPQRAVKVSAWSGVVTASFVTATLFLGLMVIAALGFFSVQPRPHSVIPNPQQVQAEPTETVEELRAQQLAAAVESVQAEMAEITKSDDKTASPAEATEHSTEAQAAFIEARKVQMQQFVSRIGQFVRANLDLVSDRQGATVFGQAAESANGGVVVFQPSDETVQQILGIAGQDLLRSFNAELPDHIRQTYALIPLTPPVGSAVSVNPLLAAGGLEKIANSIVSLVERTESAAPIVTTDSPTASAEADNVRGAESEYRSVPDWVNGTDGRRIVVHTKPILQGDDADTLLTIAVNEALSKHVESITAAMNADLHRQARFVRMELPPATAKKYTVDTYERLETVETQTEGATPFRVLYALLEFPEAVDQMAVHQLRQSIQRDRILGLGVVVAFVWLSVCASGFGIRQWLRGTKLGRVTAIPVFAVAAIPTLLIAICVVFMLSNGEFAKYSRNSRPVTIDLEHM